MKFIYRIIFVLFYFIGCSQNNSDSDSNHNGETTASTITGTVSANRDSSKIIYSINLDDKYKTKIDGNSFYYRIPVGTEAIISSKRDDTPFDSNWYNGKGDMIVNEFPTISVNNYLPLTIVVIGKPAKHKSINCLEQYPYKERAFHIEWAVFPEQELKPEQINSQCLEIDDVFDGEKSSKKFFIKLIKDTDIIDKIIILGKFKFRNKALGDKFIDLRKATITCSINIIDTENIFNVPCTLLFNTNNISIQDPIHLPIGEESVIEDCKFGLSLKETGLIFNNNIENNSNNIKSSKLGISFFIGGVDSGLKLLKNN